MFGWIWASAGTRTADLYACRTRMGFVTSQGFLPKYTSGVRQIGESTVVISRGLGDSEPYPRIFNQPELVVIDVEKS